jgi:hypothetical protein
MTQHLYRTYVYSGLLAALCLAGCHHEDAAPASGEAAKVATSASVVTTPSKEPPKSLRSNPDFGGVASQHVEVTATGATLEGAVDNAIRLAVEQVNGKRIDAASLQTSVGASNGSEDVTSAGYANMVASATSGAVSHFQLLSQKQVNLPSSSDEESLKASQGASWNKGNVEASASADASTDDASASVKEAVKGSYDQHQGASQVDYQGKHTNYTPQWEVRIGADVATYREAASAKLTRVVVAMPEVKSPVYHVGDNTISSDAIASDIRSKVSDAITQTHRFTVLDRTADAAIQQEIGRIQSGNSTTADTARLGQQLATDLIVIPTIERFEYIRHERALRMADRTLVSYSGGGEVSFRVVNAATGQQVMSQSFRYAFPETAPTTLGVSVDGNKLASDMMDAVDRNIVSSILQSTYPLSVLQLQGRSVVINQGGDAVQPGATYQAVALGKPLVDPQSGQSLGPTESPCCSVTIDRVTPNLSYGHIVEDNIHIDFPFVPGSLELRGQMKLASTETEALPPKESARTQANHLKREASAKNETKPDSNW